MVHPRTKQGHHGRKGGHAGDCKKAKLGGKMGGADAHKGGKASNASGKSKISFFESLRIVERFLGYDQLRELLPELTKDGPTRDWGNSPKENAFDLVKSFVFW